MIGQKFSISVSYSQSNFIVEKNDSFIYINYPQNCDLRYSLPSGYPDLPYIPSYILLPHNAQINCILVTDSKVEPVSGSFNIIPESMKDTANEESQISTDDFSSSADGYLPAYNEIVIFDSAQLYAGFQINKIFICPFKYLPETHQLFFYPKLDLDVYYELDEKPVNLEASQEKIRMCRDFIRSIVINKEEIEKIIPLEEKIDYSKVQIFREVGKNAKSTERVNGASSKPKESVEPFYIRQIKLE